MPFGVVADVGKRIREFLFERAARRQVKTGEGASPRDGAIRQARRDLRPVGGAAWRAREEAKEQLVP